MSKGFTLWFTGLSGAGKTTIAEIVGPELERRGLARRVPRRRRRPHASLQRPRVLEGGPRHEHRAHRLGRLAAARHGGAVLVSAISPYEETRQKARDMVEEHGPFVEVFVATSVEECARRDVKGLYEKAFSGEIKEFTGVVGPVRGAGRSRSCGSTPRRTSRRSRRRSSSRSSPSSAWSKRACAA